MASTCSSGLACVESLIVDWIVHPLNYFIVSARMLEAIFLSSFTFAYFFCELIVMGGSEYRLSVVTLLTLRS